MPITCYLIDERGSRGEPIRVDYAKTQAEAACLAAEMVAAESAVVGPPPDTYFIEVTGFASRWAVSGFVYPPKRFRVRCEVVRKYEVEGGEE